MNQMLFYTTGVQQLHDVCKRICFSGFKYYHNPKHSGPNTGGGVN